MRRVVLSSGATSTPAPGPQLQDLLQRATALWNTAHPRLTRLAVPAAREALEAVDAPLPVATAMPEAGTCCSVCLQPASGESKAVLHLYGRCYHAPCANLWSNRVTSMLPTLAPPAR